MHQGEYLANRLKEVLTEGKWVTGSNFKNEITTVNWGKAILKKDNLNSIALLTFHVHYYIKGIIEVLEGGSLNIKDKFSFDAPEISSEKDWKDLIHLFSEDSEKLIVLVKQMSNDELQKDFIDKKYGNYYRNIDVLIEHTYYHFGQVLLIKKLIA